jgi:hypothetical protein
MQQILRKVYLPLAVLQVGVTWFPAYSQCPYCCLQDLEDLTQQLDATLGSVQPSAGSYTLGDDPLSSSAHLTGPNEHDMSYPTYGQLVTPTRDLQQQQQQQQQQAAASVGQAAGVSDTAPSSVAAETGAPGTSSSMSDTRSSSNPLHAVQQAPQPAAAQPQPAAVGYGAPPEPQDSMGSIPSPRAPQQPGVDLPLVVSVSDPLRREAAGMLGMKGER